VPSRRSPTFSPCASNVLSNMTGLLSPCPCFQGMGPGSEGGSSKRDVVAAPHPQLGRQSGMKTLPGRFWAQCFWPPRCTAAPSGSARPRSGRPSWWTPRRSFRESASRTGSSRPTTGCPVTKRKLSVAWPPVYVNGQPIGFC
jgi:hypothetical protein